MAPHPAAGPPQHGLRSVFERDDDPSAVQASWLNQIEIYFSVVQRKLLTPYDFPDLEVLANRFTAFEARHNTAARPFDWRFNRTDLNRLLARIAA